MWFLKFQVILKIIPHTKHFRSWVPFCQSSMRTMVETQDSRRTQFVRMTGICKSLALFLLIYHCISDDIIFIFFTKDSTRILWTTPTGQLRQGRAIESLLLTRGGGRWSSPSLGCLVLSNCILFACRFLFQVFWYQAIFSRLNDGTKLRPIKYVDHKMILFFSSCVEFLVEDDGDFEKTHASWP